METIILNAGFCAPINNDDYEKIISHEKPRH